ncbi:MAG: PAS domain S-box protein [Nannocystis sp.]|nr:PAS domain S-box protein [Nannocystis sp.]MBA3545006.1 PAS domain S-box protein [Nannocystis sp.]
MDDLQRLVDELRLRQVELERDNAALRRSQTELRAELERKQTEENSIWRHSLAQLIANASPLAFYVFDDRSDEILYFNQRFCEIWGIQRLSERMRGGQLSHRDILPECLAMLIDGPAFEATCEPPGSETDRVAIDDELQFTDGRTVRRYSTHLRDEHDRYYGRFYMFADITDRKRTAVALRESEAKFSSAFEHAVIGMALISAQGRWLRVNQAVCDLLGYRVDELLTRTFQDVTHPEDLQADLAQLRQVLVGKLDAYQMEKRYLHRAGHVVWGWLSVSVVRAPTGVPRFFISQIVDITARKQTEAALRISAQRLEASQSIARLGGWELDLATQSLFWTAETYRIHDTSPAAFNPSLEASLSFFRARSRPIITAAVQAAMEDGQAFDLELGARTTRGRRLDVRITCAVILQEGRPVKLTGIIQDITDRKQAEVTLRESEQRLASIVDSAMDAIITVDESRRILVFNAAAGAMFRCSAEDAIDRPIEHLVPQRFRAGHADQLRAFNIDGPSTRARADRVAITGLRADGEEFPAELSLSRIEVQGQQIYSVIVRDVSARHAAEAARDALEAQLRVSQKMKAIGTLASGIAHDFNNILGAIYGYTELARQHAGPNPAVLEFLDEVSRAASRAAALVRQILAFSRQEQLQRQPMHLAPVVQEVLQLLRAVVPSSITFQTALARDAWPVLANPTQIHQIVMNLGTNAAHAMQGRTGKMVVTLDPCLVDAELTGLVPDLRPGPHVRLTMTDTGHGMDRATSERVFDPFFTTKAPGEGTGLGLSVVHGIMRSHDGAITVRSAPGEGTTFDLYFPALISATPETTATTTAVLRGNGERILFVDDDEALGRLGRRMLERLGYVVEVQSRPQLALDAVRARPDAYDVVVTDLTMPELRGTDLAQHMRQVNPALPILLTSGYSADLTPASMQAVGIQEVLLKPFTAAELAAAIHRVLAAKQPG